MITIIDYDMGNVASIKNMFHKIGADDVKISREKNDILTADKLVLPGVGAFDQGVNNLKGFGIYNLIREAVLDKRIPIMGICLGMQLLGRKSEEGSLEGLALLPFDSVRFNLSSEYKVPHMGWNRLELKTPCLVLQGSEGKYVYFVHSYCCQPEDPALITSVCDYGTEVTASIGRGNVFGVQYHPEKSSAVGLEMLQRFVEL